MPEKNAPVRNRYDFVYLFDCHDGNPNGDPDYENRPRFDPQTLQGLVTDVCLKRKIRDYVLLLKSAKGSVEPGYDIFVLSGITLEARQRLPYDHLKLEPRTNDGRQIHRARHWMCENFYDVRMFGAVMATTDFNCGQVRGPVQITFARSLDPVSSTEHTITRVTFTLDAKAKQKTRGTEMGRKHTVSYGLYRAYGFVSPAFASQTGFSEEDLEVLWTTLLNMFEVDRTAARGLMSPRGLFVFRHDSALGCAPAHRLFERIAIQKRAGVESPSSFEDYVVTVNEVDLPPGVRLLKMC
jgi:CRISPR-associated protein Csd2